MATVEDNFRKLVGPWNDSEAASFRIPQLLKLWRDETAPLSSSSQIVGHPAYQEIIALGEPALPYLFRDLEESRDGRLSKALTAITGCHPVPPEDRGKIKQVAEAWLRWAKENGHQW